ncbi:hypothetical protein HanRHA438_Chr01g0033801 [Helianthus annuus]|uniref:Uncharacterized protein n=1 Tax=Helianthus annuus TaxID=4232 RepID=A0A251VNR2_HELAN|nr:hypothetical protein HanXRQr2_Chr01g0033031 [Helianthus annuus]KAJ0627723.1 hypothetical protein HanHA89_Chr01g0028961 [Helianthus annuus]KAJ0784017.1 hypothetical protein HanLR1_Chr01g0027481 [Helianthus annuus]KAJ0948989.1 hypothetical protein HanRHA438_Chr01g0033801 [Helianthus annuus]
MGQNSTIAKWASKLLKNGILDYDEKDVTLVKCNNGYIHISTTSINIEIGK